MSDADLSAGEIQLPIKRTTGETIEERLTGNAYHNILPARYLRKDADGWSKTRRTCSSASRATSPWPRRSTRPTNAASR